LTKNKSKTTALLGAAILMGTMSYAQTIENVTFSAVASSNDNFQPVMGTPYGASFSGANGSLEISASYGESSYEQSSLSTEELKLLSSIRVFPNPTTYVVNVDLSQLPQGEYVLYLLDLAGKVVYKQIAIASNAQIDMTLFSIGTYMLNVQTKASQKIENFKIIKSK
jgi:opacity protein-like surface antigen